MPTIKEAIYSALTGESTISALVSTRVYPSRLPQKPSYPAIVFSKIDTDRHIAHDGPGDLAHPRFQFDCYAQTDAAAENLSNVLRTYINGFRGTFGGLAVHGIIFIDELDDYGSVADVSRVSSDYRIAHKE